MNFSEQFRQRTKAFALAIVRYYQDLPKTGEAQMMGRQLFRSGTSVAANYRAACRGRSKAEFIAKLGIVVEEADESVFWLEMFYDSGIQKTEETKRLLKEAEEIMKVASTSYHSAKKKSGRKYLMPPLALLGL